jgi:hypothetical protein
MTHEFAMRRRAAHDGGDDRAGLHDDGILVPASLRIAFADQLFQFMWIFFSCSFFNPN